jgi:hypothetical protein
VPARDHKPLLQHTSGAVSDIVPDSTALHALYQACLARLRIPERYPSPTGASLTNGSRANFSKQAHPPLPSPQCYVTTARASLVGMATPTTTCAEPSAVPRDRSTPLFSLCVSNHSTDQTIAPPRALCAPPPLPSAWDTRFAYTEKYPIPTTQTTHQRS